MSMQSSVGALRCTAAGGGASLRLVRWSGATPTTLALTADVLGWYYQDAQVAVRLTVDPPGHEAPRIALASADGCERPAGEPAVLRLSVTTDAPQRLGLLLSAHHPEEPFFLLPGTIFGDNNLVLSGPDHFPNLTTQELGRSCSPRWELRTDRHPLPVAMVWADHHLAAIAGPPYLDLPGGGFVRTGLLAELPATVGFTLGYRNQPLTFANKDDFREPTEAVLPAGVTLTVPLRLYLRAGDRTAAFGVARDVYEAYYQPPQASLAPAAAIAALADVCAVDGWDPEHRAFVAQQVKGLPDAPVYRPVGGKAIAWVGGVNVAYPLLLAGQRLGRADYVDIARDGLDRLAAHVNPANALFFDAMDEQWQPSVNYWWSGISNKGLHSAYTNGEACYYFLAAAAADPEHGEPWAAPALAALETMLGLQRADGSYGYAYHTDRAEVAVWEGYAGCWFGPAMLLAHDRTGDDRYLQSALQAAEFYGRWVETLDVWGTPMDTYRGNDEEGVLALIRLARMLHERTGDDDHLDLLRLGAEYEFLWRYGYNARPEAEPLKSAPWTSCGGSVTSVSNPHIHPMGLLVAPDLRYLYQRTGDEHVRQRLEDSVTWACNCLEIRPRYTGFGRLGWTGERYCPSDGLLVQKYADGSPSSIEHGLNLWATGAFLEGLLLGGSEPCEL